MEIFETKPSIFFFSCDKIRKYHTDYNNNPPNVISFMPVIVSTSGKLHIEFIRHLFLQAHRETDHFFVSSRSHTHPLHLQTSRLLTSPLSLGVPVPLTTQCM